MVSFEVVVRSLWHALITFEVIASTLIHCTYGLTILLYTLLTDAFATLATVAVPEDCQSAVYCGRIKAAEKLNKAHRDVVALSAGQSSSLEQDDQLADENNGCPELNLRPDSASVLSKVNGESRTEAPIVLLHGIFGFGHGKFGSTSYFGGAEYQEKDIYVPDLGSLTSIHDRARELFFYLKGGRTDYGEEHSQKYGHNRFGTLYVRGKHEGWSAERPVHLVGHSSGVQVARVLQHMLHTKAFEGHPDTSADWVASITSISGALNGTTRVYIDGLSVRDGVHMLPICLLQVLRFGVLFYEWLDLKSCKAFYCFGFDHFPLSRHIVGLAGLLSTLANRTGPFATGDWILPDLSLQRCFALNQEIQTHPNTFYFSYATVKTRAIAGRVLPAAMTIHPLLTLRCLQMSLWRRPMKMPPPYEGYRDEHWWHNDGALNTISMLYPRFPTPHPHCLIPLDHPSAMKRNFQPGIWYYTVLEGDHILYIISRLRAGVKFDVLYDSIFRRCRSSLTLLPAAPSPASSVPEKRHGSVLQQTLEISRSFEDSTQTPQADSSPARQEVETVFGSQMRRSHRGWLRRRKGDLQRSASQSAEHQLQEQNAEPHTLLPRQPLGFLDLDLGNFTLYLRLPGIRLPSVVAAMGARRGALAASLSSVWLAAEPSMRTGCGCACHEGGVRDVFDMLELCCPASAAPTLQLTS